MAITARRARHVGVRRRRARGRRSARRSRARRRARRSPAGTTVLSSSVHSATQTGPAGVSSPALSPRSRSESGSSCWQASGQACEPSEPASAARSVPWCGEARVTARRTSNRRRGRRRRAAPPRRRRSSRRGRPTAPRSRRASSSTARPRSAAWSRRSPVPEPARLDDPDVAALGLERVGQHLQRGRRAAVARHQQHRPGLVLGDRLDRRPLAARARPRSRRPRPPGQHHDAQHEPAASRGQRGEHAHGHASSVPAG